MRMKVVTIRLNKFLDKIFQGFKSDQTDGYEGSELTPQIPAPDDLRILTYPLSPHEGPHEFLTIQ